MTVKITGLSRGVVKSGGEYELYSANLIVSDNQETPILKSTDKESNILLVLPQKTVVWLATVAGLLVDKAEFKCEI
jgi:hypothetical protein